MNVVNGTIYLVCGDAAVAQRCSEALAAYGTRCRISTASTVEQARKVFTRNAPAAVFLDESVLGSRALGDALETSAALLTESGPVVVAAVPEMQTNLAYLITSGAVDFVARTGNFVPIVAGILDRRARLAQRARGAIQLLNEELSGDFGEILRHEVNNPLTGILGNTELLLARRDRLPSAAVERLETIAELAVRLRETIRRLSNAWEERHEHARPA